MYTAPTSGVRGVDRATAGASADEVVNATAEQPLIPQPRRLRIQIVEDDALIGLLLGDMLELMGYEVCAIEATEIAAVSAAARCEPDLLIVDANLWEGSGVSAVDQILAKGFVPHVFVTGDLRGVLDRRPAAIVISKPFTEKTLSDAIDRARLTV